jgi:hypothetical protein
MEKLPCGHDEEKIMGIEYHGLDPDHYDGVSEWRCEECLRRWGRWTKKELFGDEKEPRYYGEIKCSHTTKY